jgi:hypothetical protein
MRYEKLKSKQLSRSPDTPASTSECRSYTSDSGPQCRRARTQSSRALWSGDTPEERFGTSPSSLPCSLAARHAAGPDSGRAQFRPLRPRDAALESQASVVPSRPPVISRRNSSAASRDHDCERAIRHHPRPDGICLGGWPTLRASGSPDCHRLSPSLAIAIDCVTSTALGAWA